MLFGFLEKKFMDKKLILLGVSGLVEEWFYEHDDFECDKCRTSKGAFNLNFYIGTHNGRQAYKYSCSNEDCGFEEIEYIDEMKVNDDGMVEKVKNADVGQRITLANNQKRILKEDKKGLYVVMGGVKNYVYYMSNYDKYGMTGEWEHKD